MFYTSPDLFAAEMLNVVAAFFAYWLLGNKRRMGWLFYLIGALALIYLLSFKDSWMSVMNQSMMCIVAIKNYYYFHHSADKIHRYFEWITILVFLCSLSFLNGLNGSSISELLLWIAIIGKTLLLGKKHISGWYFQILQQSLSVVFGLYRDIYMYVLKGGFFALQGIWGFLKWRRRLS